MNEIMTKKLFALWMRRKKVAHMYKKRINLKFVLRAQIPLVQKTHYFLNLL